MGEIREDWGPERPSAVRVRTKSETNLFPFLMHRVVWLGLELNVRLHKLLKTISSSCLETANAWALGETAAAWITHRQYYGRAYGYTASPESNRPVESVVCNMCDA